MADQFQISVKEYKGAFFNKHAIETQVDYYKMAEMSRHGAYTRTRMKSLLRYANKASKPGNPPRVIRTDRFTRKTTNKKTGVTTSRATSPLKELIFFAHDKARDSVVVGPAKFGNKPGIVPPTLEKGGPAVIRVPVPRPKGQKASPKQAEAFKRLVREGRIILPPRQFRLTTIRIAPRPFVKRAGEEELRSGKFRKAGP
jgi:hypothetical protein